MSLTSETDPPVFLQTKPLLITLQVWLPKNQHQDVKSRNLTLSRFYTIIGSFHTKIKQKLKH